MKLMLIFIIPFMSLLGWFVGYVIQSNYERRQFNSWVINAFSAFIFGLIGVLIGYEMFIK